MRAIILVGGRGMRLRPLTIHTPKPIVPVLNQPLLLYQIKLLKRFGITDICLSSFYLPQKLRDILGSGEQWGVQLKYVLEEFPLGTGGAARNAFDHGSREATIVFNGDILTCLDLAELLRFHQEKRSQATLVLTPVEDPTAYGLVETDSTGQIESFLEKPSEEEINTNNISAGTYVFEPEVFDLIAAGQNVSFERETFPLLLKEGRPFYGFCSTSYWLDIGTPEKYLQANLDLIDQSGNWQWAFAEEMFAPGGNLAVIGTNSQILSKAVYRSAIGANCKVAAGATVRSSVLWEDVVVEKNAEVKHSLIGRGCVIGERCRLRNVVLSDGTILKEGSILY